MFRTLFITLLVASPIAGVCSESSRSVAAVQKVIQMLQDMEAKSKQEKNDEQVAMAKFETWCKMEIPQTKKSIAKAAEMIELLNAEIAKLTVEAKVLGEEIAKLQANVASFESEKAAATAQREKDNKNYIEESTDYGESVDALDRAIMVLTKNAGDKPAASAVLLQLATSDHLTAQAKSMVAAFLGVMGKDFMSDMGPDYEAPEANAYESQSSGIIGMLKKLKDEFRTKLADCQKEEMNSKHAYEMVVQDLVDAIENSNQSIEEKKITKARKQEKASQDKKELGATIRMKAEDEKTLSDMEVECQEKHLSFEEKQQLRTDEITAIGKAVEILKSPESSGNADKYLDLAQTSKSTALTQLRGQESAGGVRGHVRDFLASEGQRLHSKSLSLLAQKVAANPFAKVTKMIDDMITRLLNEANEDAQHEGFCDKEIGKSKVTRNKLSEDIDGLNAAVEDGKATIMMLAEEIKTLSQELADLDASVAEATKLRSEEKATNKVTVADTQAAQGAVAAATAVLKTFYEKAAMATGLLQVDVARPKMGTDEWKALANPNFEPTGAGYGQGSEDKVDKGHKAGMQTFGKKYSGNQDAAGGVMAMLEVILSDFANLEADTKASEASAQTAFETFMVESKKTKAVKSKKVEMDNSDKAAAELKLQEDTKDLKGTQDELLAADRYYEKLVPQCIDQGQTFEERTASREAEIASLKQAFKLLG